MVGLNAQIRGVADRLSPAGYIALVPDLYRGKSTVEEEEAHHYMDSLDFADAISQDVRGAVQYLSTYTRNIGVTGFCMGGALTLLALSAVPEFAAGVYMVRIPAAGSPGRFWHQSAHPGALGHTGCILSCRGCGCA